MPPYPSAEHDASPFAVCALHSADNVGATVGDDVGLHVGTMVGFGVGHAVGDVVGLVVGASELSQQLR